MFRKPPTGFSRLFMRAPIWLYRLRLGWLLGGRCLLLEHRGRSSGKRRAAVIEVVDHDRETSRYCVAAAYGDRVGGEPPETTMVGSYGSITSPITALSASISVQISM